MKTIELTHDINLSVATGLRASSKVWKNTKMMWSDLARKLSEVVTTPETHAQFMRATKDEQGKIKDVGGFVGGYLTGGRREKSAVLYRQVVTLDADFSHDSLWWDFTLRYDCAALIHSTHKSCPGNLRHRLVIPLDREVNPEEYQAIARRIAGDLGIDFFDPSTFDINRLMFWPSVPRDVEFYFEIQDGPILSADSVLATYANWEDTTEWPTSSNALADVAKAASKQEDPCSKKGIIGAFCRTYSIQDAIEKFLPDVYAPVSDDRYTYLGGTTSGGLVTYEDKFAYSHHGTDPISGKLCNAFDLIRIHKFGSLDASSTVKDEKDRKSFKAMEEFAANDSETKKTIAAEKFEEARFEFAEGNEPEEDYDASWTDQLEVNSKGEYENSAANINTILQNDQFLRNAFKLNTFDNKRYVVRSLPWRKVSGVELFRDVDYAGVRNYIECVYGITSNQKVDDALSLEFEKKRFHPIIDYIKAQVWDGTPRVNSLLIDYFGAEDNPYTRAAIRKMLCAAVARVFEPGIKFDTALILVGDQGTYKSTFVKKLGREWFSDTFTTVQGKESFEQIQGAWIVEIAELSGLKKAEVETIKHYISKREDSFRPAYGRVVETYRRQCVFFGTTNNKDFLRDPSGNRRFLPVDVRQSEASKSVADDLTDYEVSQIWAEAYLMYKAGEPLYLQGDEESLAKVEQGRHSEVDERMGIVEKYLNTLLPENWNDMDLYERRNWLDDPLTKKGTRERVYVCAAEIWCECLCKEKGDMSRYNTREINDLLRSLPDWEFSTSTRNFPIYGKQKYFYRKDDIL